MHLFQRKVEDEKLKELVELANMSEKEISKANYKEKQAHYRAKAKLCKVFYNETGPYIKRKKK